MATAIDDSIPMTDEDFEAQLTSALARLEARSPAELTDEVIAQRLFEASNNDLGPADTAVAQAQTVFTTIKVMKVTKTGSSNPTADGATVYQWLGTSTGNLAYSAYSGSSRFVARNRVRVPGRPGDSLVVAFFKGADGREQFATFVGNAVPSYETRNRGIVQWTS